MAPNPRRRALEDDELSDDSSSVSSQASKRRRLNSSQPNADSPGGDLLPESYRTMPRGGYPTNSERHKPGSLLKIKMKNFVTYTDAVFKCGPSLNMIIGPNGTGKSTLVCAICLGLGWKPNVLGRAKDIGEFVKYGNREAELEVELMGREGEENPIIHHTMKREGNKSSWRINGRNASHKDVMSLVRSYNIQIDNLCQFLPQDRVVEFAALKPVALLEATIKAVCEERMTTWHTELKTYSANRTKMKQDLETNKTSLSNLEKRHTAQQIDVQRIEERQGLLTRVEGLKRARIPVHFAIAKAKVDELKETKRSLQSDMKEVEDQVGPALETLNDKEGYFKDVQEAVRQKAILVSRLDSEAQTRVTRYSQKVDEIKQCEVEHESEVAANKKKKEEIPRLQNSLRSLQSQLEQEPAEVDTKSFNDRVREKDQKIRGIKEKASETQHRQGSMKVRVAERQQARNQASQELSDLHSQAGQQTAKLKALSADSARAWEWLRRNQNEFKEQIYGPSLVECSVKEGYADVMESILGKGDLVCFTATNYDDWKKFMEYCQRDLRLRDITIRRVTRGLEHFQSPVSKQDLVSYGLQDWASDLLTGPEPVLAMLCDTQRLHRTGVSLSDSTDEQFEILKESPIQNWVAGGNSYRVTRRREYGPSAVSTAVTRLKTAQFWSAGVDKEAERAVHRQMKEIESDLAGLEENFEEIKAELETLQPQMRELEREKADILTEKGDLQKARSQWLTLPFKISTLEEKYNGLVEQQNQHADRLDKINADKATFNLERLGIANDYVHTLELAQKEHDSLVALEIQAIEAESEFDIAKEHSTEARRMLEEIQRRIQAAEQEYRVALDEGKKLSKAVIQMQRELSGLEGGEAISAVVHEWVDQVEPKTLDDLEAEITSTKQRIELLQEDNPDIMRQFQSRAKHIEKLQSDVASFEGKLEELDNAISRVRAQWEPKLDKLVETISTAFSNNFERIGCAGQVSIGKHEEDFSEWSINIEVKFRESETLSALDQHRQSGGERSVSTIFYLMSLQSLAKSPFRVVDEINQGMDPRNERMVHERIVDIACAENTNQYFLITPKLLNGLKYHERMSVHVIYSGEEIPQNAGDEALDFRKLADLALRVAGKVN